MIELLLFIVLSPFILIPLYIIGIQYERGGKYKPLVVMAAIGLFVDFIANMIPLSIILWELPLKHSTYLNRREYTFSDRLERIVLETGWRTDICRPIAKALNMIAPSKVHIHNYKEN